VFRGMLDVSAEQFTEEMALAAARAIADVVGEEKLNPTVIVPSVFDPRVTPAVAAAIRNVVKGAPAPANPAAAPEAELQSAPEETF
jgi:malate dehydrogenase (oxaloacetate-decarboxylating)